MGKGMILNIQRKGKKLLIDIFNGFKTLYAFPQSDGNNLAGGKPLAINLCDTGVRDDNGILDGYVSMQTIHGFPHKNDSLTRTPFYLNLFHQSGS